MIGVMFLCDREWQDPTVAERKKAEPVEGVLLDQQLN